MLSITPTLAKLIAKDDEPYEINGSGMPAKGIIAVIPPMLIRDSKTNQEVIPAATSLPNMSGAFLAILNPRKAKNNSNKSRRLIRTKPNSSDIIAKIESPIVSGN